jgi:hypothetical protein
MSRFARAATEPACSGQVRRLTRKASPATANQPEECRSSMWLKVLSGAGKRADTADVRNLVNCQANVASHAHSRSASRCPVYLHQTALTTS